MNAAVAIQLALLLPLAGAALSALLRRRATLAAGTLAVIAAATAAVLASQLARLRSGSRPTFNLVQLFPGVWIGFRIEPLGLLFALIVAGLWIPASVHAIGWLRAGAEPRPARLLSCTALAIALAVGAALARNLLTLFVFLELLPLACAPLVARSSDDGARRAVRTFLGTLLGLGGTLFFLALVWTFHLAGTLELRPGGILAGRADELDAGLLLASFAFGIGPLALVPTHRWLVAAMHVSPPARAFPIAAVLAPAGAFAFVEVAVHAFGPEVLAELSAARWLGWAAALTILWGAVRALRAREVKDAVAGAVLAQLGVFALGALCDPGAAVAELGPRIALPAAGALALYLCAANLELAARRTGLDELAGLGRAMPLAFAGFALGALALLLPGSIAAWGPWRETALRPAWLGALALGTLAGLAALLAVPWRAFRRSPPRVVPEGDPLLVRGAPPVLALAPALALLAGGALCWLSSRVPAP